MDQDHHRPVPTTLNDMDAFAGQQSQTRQTHLHLVSATDADDAIRPIFIRVAQRQRVIVPSAVMRMRMRVAARVIAFVAVLVSPSAAVRVLVVMFRAHA